MAMTFGQMYEIFQTLWDKAGNPYLPEEQFDEIANIKLNDYVTDECSKIEQGQEHTVRIHALYRPFSKLNSSELIIPDDVPGYRYLLRIKQKYRKDCNGKITYPEVPVRKAPNNNVDEMQKDPFNVGIDEDPTYVPSFSNGKQIYKINSTNIPLEISGTYVKNPAKIDSDNNPNTVFELPDFVAEEIIRSIVFRSDMVIENFQRAQMEGGEQQELKMK